MRVATLLMAAVLALPGAAVAQDVTYDYDKTADFSRFKTYAWVPGTNLADDLNHKRIMSAVDSQLALKGLVRAEPGTQPDLVVAYHAAFDKNLRVSASGWGGYRYAGSRSGTARAEEVVQGTLVVDLVDATTRSIVWRSIATKELDTKASPEKRDKNLHKAAEKMFKKYPPQG